MNRPAECWGCLDMGYIVIEGGCDLAYWKLVDIWAGWASNYYNSGPKWSASRTCSKVIVAGLGPFLNWMRKFVRHFPRLNEFV